MSKIALTGNALGSGTLTLAAPNTNTDRTLTLPDEAGTVLTTAGVPASAMPAGSVIQVVQGIKTDTASYADGDWRDTLLSVSITPSLSSSKIFVMYSGQFSSVSSAYNIYTRITRNGTAIGIADLAGSRPQATSASTRINDGNSYQSSYGFFLDAPASTSSLTYKLEVWGQTGGGTFYINRTGAGDSNNNDSCPRTASTITVMEIAG